MIRTSQAARWFAILRLLTAVACSAVVVAGCGSGLTDEGAGRSGEPASPPAAASHEAVAPPTTNTQGGFGLPKAEAVTSLGIEGVTEVKFPETCEIELVALDEAVGFSVGSAIVSPTGHENLATIAQERLVGANAVSIVGHTSSEGDPAFNLRLSEERAAAVQGVLQPLVPGATFSIEGRGPSELVRAADGTEDRVASRRVVITAQLKKETCSAFGS